jgi:hypothetical protein
MSQSKVASPNLDEFTSAYIEAALWSSTDDQDQPLDKYSLDDIAPESLEAMVKDCQEFQQQCGALIEDEGEGLHQAGHDFWLTRVGHGAGFWDGDWPKHGDELTKVSEKFGNVDLYVGDDGYIYQAGTEKGEPQPPKDMYEPTVHDAELLKTMGIEQTASAKTAVFAEDQWVDILKKLGYVIDEEADTEWEDTVYCHPIKSDIQVMIHEGPEPYFLVERGGELVQQGQDSEELWQTLSNLHPTPVKHDREFTEEDKAGPLKEMGVLAHTKNALLRKKKPKLAFDMSTTAPKQYDYEASGNDVVLISPANATKHLQGDEAESFWAGLDSIESTLSADASYEQMLQDFIKSFFDKEVAEAKKYGGLFDFDRRQNDIKPDAERRKSVMDNAKMWAHNVQKVDDGKAADFALFYSRQSPDGSVMLGDVWPKFEAKYASMKYAIQVDATKLKKASVAYVSGVDNKGGKIHLTTNKAKAVLYSRAMALKIKAALPGLELTGKLVRV